MQGRGPQGRRIGATVLCGLLLTCALLPAGPTASAGPAVEDPSVLAIESVSAWVESEGEFVVEFAPTTEVPLDATFTWTIEQAVRPGDTSIRDQVGEVLEDDEARPILQAPRSAPVLELGVPAEGLRFVLPIRSQSGDSERTLVPTAGVHPTRLSLEDNAGVQLWSATVYLNRLPTSVPAGRDGATATTAVQLVTSLDSQPAFAPDGTVDFGDGQAELSASLALLAQVPDLPLIVALRPNTLLGLSRADSRAEKDFVRTAAGASWVLAGQSYVDVDASALAAAPGAELGRQVDIGAGVLEALVGRRPDGALWVLDDTVDERAAVALQERGVRHLLTNQNRFLVEGQRTPPATARTFALDGTEAMTVSAPDPELTRQLILPDTSAGGRVNRTTTLMMADWFDALASGGEAFPGVSAAIVVPNGAEPEVLENLVDVLTTGGAGAPLALADTAAATFSRGEVARARLTDVPVSELADDVARTQAVDSRIAGVASMTSTEHPDVSRWREVNNQTPSDQLTDAQRSASYRTVSAEIDATIAAIEVPTSRTIVLTARSATIPLRFRNGLDVPVTLRMRTRSPRLEFPEGEVRDVVLQPGENRLDLPVSVQAPGPSLLRIQLTSPDGRIQLPDASLTVRSSSISGVGAVLSALSILVLVLWWVRSRRRR